MNFNISKENQAKILDAVRNGTNEGELAIAYGTSEAVVKSIVAGTYASKKKNPLFKAQMTMEAARLAYVEASQKLHDMILAEETRIQEEARIAIAEKDRIASDAQTAISRLKSNHSFGHAFAVVKDNERIKLGHAPVSGFLKSA